MKATVPVAVRFATPRLPEMPALPWTESLVNGVVVPMPRLPAMYAFPVVVAPPEMVRPPACAPEPMVEEAETRIPSVVVGASAPKVTRHSRFASVR